MRNYIKNKRIFIFFIIAFTLTFLVFSMGKSALDSQNRRIAKYNNEKNKIVGVTSNYNLKAEELSELLKEIEVTIQLNYLSDISGEMYLVTTNVKEDGFSILDDLREGKYLTSNDYKSDDLVGVFSTTVSKEDKIKLEYRDEEGSLKSVQIKKIGQTFSVERTIDVPNKVFYKLTQTNNLADKNITMVFSGEREEIDKSISLIESYIKEIDGNSKVDITSWEVPNKNDSGKELFNAALLIILITIVNSFALTSLWVMKNKKELVIRKVCGAKNIDLLNNFFGKLIPIATLSVVIAVIIQYIISTSFKGIFLNFDIRVNASNLFYTLVLSFGVAFITSLPALYYISKVQPANLLKEE